VKAKRPNVKISAHVGIYTGIPALEVFLMPHNIQIGSGTQRA